MHTHTFHLPPSPSPSTPPPRAKQRHNYQLQSVTTTRAGLITAQWAPEAQGRPDLQTAPFYYLVFYPVYPLACATVCLAVLAPRPHGSASHRNACNPPAHTQHTKKHRRLPTLPFFDAKRRQGPNHLQRRLSSENPQDSPDFTTDARLEAKPALIIISPPFAKTPTLPRANRQPNQITPGPQSDHSFFVLDPFSARSHFHDPSLRPDLDLSRPPLPLPALQPCHPSRLTSPSIIHHPPPTVLEVFFPLCRSTASRIRPSVSTHNPLSCGGFSGLHSDTSTEPSIHHQTTDHACGCFVEPRLYRSLPRTLHWDPTGLIESCFTSTPPHRSRSQSARSGSTRRFSAVPPLRRPSSLLPA